MGGGGGIAVCVLDGADVGELFVLGAVEEAVGAGVDVPGGGGGEGGVLCESGEGVEGAVAALRGCGWGVV